MKSLKSLKKRLNTVKSTAQITKALQMVSTSKMRKAQDTAFFIREYQNEIRELIKLVSSNLHRDTKISLNKLQKFLGRDFKKSSTDTTNVLLVLFAPTKGFCGALISNMLNFMYNWLQNFEDETINLYALGLQQKSRYILQKFPQIKIEAIFERPIEQVSLQAIAGEFKMTLDKFLDGQIDEVYTIYPKFINTFTYKIVANKLLPLKFDKLIALNSKDTTDLEQGKDIEFIIEPDIETFLLKAIERYLEIEFLSAIANTKASEHSARMIAMKNATDNAENLKQTLRLQFNRLRQESITNELLDIIGGTLNS